MSTAEPDAKPAATRSTSHVERLGAWLDAARRKSFVGRAVEVEAFEQALAESADGMPAVFFVFGPGGIGKSTLLGEFRHRALVAGRAVLTVDAREIDRDAAGFERALQGAARTSGRGIEVLDDSSGVLLVDAYELLGSIDAWLRDELLPQLPAGWLVVVAGRDAPDAAWRVDPGWRDFLRVVDLAPLDDAESLELLARAGVTADACGRLALLGRGHPLALSLLAEVARSGEVVDDLAAAPDLVAALLRVFVTDVPDEVHRRGLLVCAHALVTSEDLLRWVLGPDAEKVWNWLTGLSFITRQPAGLSPHDLARDVLEADLRSRAPAAYRELHRAVRDHVVHQMRTMSAPERRHAALQLVYLHRASPHMGAYWDARSNGLGTIVTAERRDVPQMLQMVEQFEDATSAQLCARWLEHSPESAWVVRDGDDVSVFGCMLTIHPLASGLREFDPVVAELLDHIERVSPPRPGEEVDVGRFMGGRSGYQTDPMFAVAGPVSSLVNWVTRPLAWSFIVTNAPEFWGPLFDYLGFTTALEIDVGGRTVVAYGNDWRRLSIDDWLDVMAERELTGESGPPPEKLLRPPPLGRDAFAAAVRTALREFRRDERLTQSSLLSTRLGGRRPSGDVEALRASFRAATANMSTEPKGALLASVLDRTYFRGAPTQEAAAEVLDLPFSTYRRHLARATDRLTDLLWAVEIGQTSLPPDLE